MMILALILLAACASAKAGIVFPTALREIEAEAFRGDGSLCGRLTLPEGVERVGSDAFTDTGLYALEVPASVRHIAVQSLNHAAYVWVHGAETTIENLSGVCMLIGPANSVAQQYAQNNGILFVNESTVIAVDNLLYALNGERMMLLCPDDPSLLGSTLDVHAEINGKPVALAASCAFAGCGQVREINLPKAMYGCITSAILAECANARVTYYDHTQPISVLAVTASTTGGTVGESVSWQVITCGTKEAVSYAYTLRYNGRVIDTQQTSSPVYSYTAQEVGAYQLSVQAQDSDGNTAEGRSKTLYIAVEALEMEVPELLVNGQDLMITLHEAAGAIGYGVYVTDETAGKPVYSSNPDGPGTLTVRGYNLNAGTYRVTGYVYGNDYRYSVPTVKMVTVAGEKAAGPIIPEQEPKQVDCDFEFTLPGETVFAIRWQKRYSDGHLEDYPWLFPMVAEEDPYIYLNTYGMDENEECAGSGGVLLLQAAAQRDGVWTDWGPVCEIVVLPRPRLEKPTISMPENPQAGKDLTISFDSVENADYYDIHIYKGEYSEETGGGELVLGETFQSGGAVTVPGYKLAAGTYTVRIYVRTNNYEEYEPNSVSVTFEVSGLRPSAPTVTPDKTEAYYSDDEVVLEIDSEDAEGAYIELRIEEYGYIRSQKVTLDEGKAKARIYLGFSDIGNEWMNGKTCIFRVAVIKDDIWSEWKEAYVTLKAHLPLDPPVITVNESMEAGRDLTFAVSAVEDADDCYVTLYRIYDESFVQSWRLEDASHENTITLPGYYLQKGNYRLEVVAYSSLRSRSQSEARFSVTGAFSDAPVVNVDETSVKTGEQFSFTINDEGAEEIYYEVKSTNGYRWPDSITVLDNPVIWTQSSSDTGTFEYRFCTRKDERWSAWSDPISVTVTEGDALAAPAVDVPNSLRLGEDMRVNVSPVEGATGYRVYLYNSRGEQILNEGINRPEGGTVTFPGYRLSRDTYRVAVKANSSTASSQTEVSVIVSQGERPAAPDVIAETETGQVNNYYSFTVSTEDAEKAVARYYRQGNTNNVNYRAFDVTGSETVWRDRSSQPGITLNYAFAVCVDGVWSSWSDTKRVTVTDREQLQPVTINVPTNAEAGQDVYYSFAGVENADYYNLALYYPDGNTIGWTAYSETEQRIAGYNLTPGVYRVVVTAYGANYTESRTERSFTVSGKRAEGPVISVSNAEVFVDEAFTFLISTENAEEAAYCRYSDRYGKNTGTLNVLSDVTAWDTSAYYAGAYYYSFAVLREGKWSAWSDPIAITVNTRPTLDPPVFNMSSRISQGSDLSVEVMPMDGISYYYVYLFNNRGQQVYNYHLNDAGTVVLRGYLLKPGDYRVSVEAYGTQHGQSMASKNVTVEEAALSTAPTVTPPENTTVTHGSYYIFTVNTEGAEKAAVRSYRIGAPNDVLFNMFNVGDGVETSWRGYQYSGGQTYAYSFAILRDGRWSQWSDFIEITVQ